MQKTKRNWKIQTAIFFVSILLLCCVFVPFVTGVSYFADPTPTPTPIPTVPPAPVAVNTDTSTIDFLVNRDYPLSSDYKPKDLVAPDIPFAEKEKALHKYSWQKSLISQIRRFPNGKEEWQCPILRLCLSCVISLISP